MRACGGGGCVGVCDPLPPDCIGPVDTCAYPNGGCPGGYNDSGGCCCYDPGSPILVDVNGDGFDMSDAAGGVPFDLYGDGRLEQVSWTAPRSDDAWLALDRNGNGRIDNGRELFGNVTLLAAGTRAAHGFQALAEYDQQQHGGNGDGFIDALDAAYSSLLLWRDSNHNGTSESNELFTLPQLQVVRISLDYRESRRRDQYGNEFRYRANVYRQENSPAHNRFAYDVFLVVNR